MISETTDNGGRRVGSDRRQFSYNGHIPERRLEEDRRGGTDRRSGIGTKKTSERRSVFLRDPAHMG